MMNEEKQKLRKQIAAQKKLYAEAQLSEWSSSLLQKLEDHPRFKRAQTVLLYHSLPDEVQTHKFIEKWEKSKRIVLPVVKGDELELRIYNGIRNLKPGCFGIGEPADGTLVEEQDIELAIIPGVAFDRQGNRLGRGKGYYDRTLYRLRHTYRIGICFGFQLLDKIPAESSDQKMNEVWTENGRVSETQYPL